MQFVSIDGAPGSILSIKMEDPEATEVVSGCY